MRRCREGNSKAEVVGSSYDCSRDNDDVPTKDDRGAAGKNEKEDVATNRATAPSEQNVAKRQRLLHLMRRPSRSELRLSTL